VTAVVLDVQMDAGRCDRRVPQVFLDEGQVGVDVRLMRVGTVANQCVEARRSVAAPSGSSDASASAARRNTVLTIRQIAAGVRCHASSPVILITAGPGLWPDGTDGSP